MPPRRPSGLERRVFKGSYVVREGLLTAKELRSSAWVRIRHDIYADSRLDVDHTVVVRAATVGAPSALVVAGTSAAYLLGVKHAANRESPVHVILPPDVRMAARVGVVVHATAIDRAETDERRGIVVTSGLRTAW